MQGLCSGCTGESETDRGVSYGPGLGRPGEAQGPRQVGRQAEPVPRNQLQHWRVGRMRQSWGRGRGGVVPGAGRRVGCAGQCSCCGGQGRVLVACCRALAPRPTTSLYLSCVFLALMRILSFLSHLGTLGMAPAVSAQWMQGSRSQPTCQLASPTQCSDLCLGVAEPLCYSWRLHLCLSTSSKATELRRASPW